MCAWVVGRLLGSELFTYRFWSLGSLFVSHFVGFFMFWLLALWPTRQRKYYSICAPLFPLQEQPPANNCHRQLGELAGSGEALMWPTMGVGCMGVWVLVAGGSVIFGYLSGSLFKAEGRRSVRESRVIELLMGLIER